MLTKCRLAKKVLPQENYCRSNPLDLDKNRLAIKERLKLCMESLRFFEFFSKEGFCFHCPLSLGKGSLWSWEQEAGCQTFRYSALELSRNDRAWIRYSHRLIGNYCRWIYPYFKLCLLVIPFVAWLPRRYLFLKFGHQLSDRAASEVSSRCLSACFWACLLIFIQIYLHY